MKEIIYVTGNHYKLFTAKQILEPLGIKVIGQKIECPEIQDDKIEEIAKFSSRYASEYLKKTILKNDTGLIIPALEGFPGPYTKYVEQTITEDGILKLLEGKENREAYFIECLALTEYGKEPVIFISKTEGTIAYEKSGEYGWGWDRIFIPNGKELTLANFNDEERGKLWSDNGYIDLANYIKKYI
jgi:XTP/dITP diphosphohydrolase